MIQLNHEDCILKILDIPADQVDHKVIQHGLWNRIAGFSEYTDKSLHEDIYNAEILQNMENAGIQLEKSVALLLEEIQILCETCNCSYFRIVDLPFNKTK